ncbi:MAG: hypothetical protein U9Q07_12115 [Planctomycetota bacterium]|nr:hypothetical protein [Planctomycetota bacterium]
MGKGKRLKRRQKGSDFLTHARDVLTRNFQKELRNSELWPQMVAEFGEKKAEELLRQCKGELKPGFVPDETGNCSTDI